jgi:hypothetical protein
MVWTGSMWLRIGTSGGLLWTWWWTFGFLKMLGSSWVAAQLAASQEGLSSIRKKDKNPPPISAATQEHQPSKPFHLTITKQCHFRCAYIGWSHNFSCMTRTENWNPVSMQSIHQHFDSTEVENVHLHWLIWVEWCCISISQQVFWFSWSRKLSFHSMWSLPHNEIACGNIQVLCSFIYCHVDCLLSCSLQFLQNSV